MANRKIKVKFKSYTHKIKQEVNATLETRMDTVSEQLAKELQLTLSKTGPSKPGEPPGVTKRRHSERVPGGLMRSIQWRRGKKLVRHIGTPLARGFWMEMGVAGGVIIRPVKAKALLVPISAAVAMRLTGGKTPKQSSGKKKRRRRKSIRKTSGLIGVVQHANGQWFMLRSFVIQGPIAPRPWLKPTLLKNLRKIGLTLGQKIY